MPTVSFEDLQVYQLARNTQYCGESSCRGTRSLETLLESN